MENTISSNWIRELFDIGDVSGRAGGGHMSLLSPLTVNIVWSQLHLISGEASMMDHRIGGGGSARGWGKGRDRLLFTANQGCITWGRLPHVTTPLDIWRKPGAHYRTGWLVSGGPTQGSGNCECVGLFNKKTVVSLFSERLRQFIPFTTDGERQRQK